MGAQEKILMHLSAYGKENKYKLARALKIDVSEVAEALDALEKEGKIEIKEGNAMPVKGKKPITTKQEKEEVIKQEKEEVIKQEKEEVIQEVEIKEQPKKEPEEQKTEISEELTEEKIEEEPPEEISEEEKIEGTVKFYNSNKRFGYIAGDDGKDYRVQESGLKEGVIIEADDRVSFKVVISYKGPVAVEVEKISESAKENVA